MPPSQPVVATSGKADAIVIVKAAPQISQRHGETVCCAGLDIYGKWHRLYPVAFRTLDDGKKFGRWDHISYAWRVSTDDGRTESRRIDQGSLEIVGELKKSEREKFLAPAIVTGLEAEKLAGRTLALLRPRSPEFYFVKRSDADLETDRVRFAKLRQQQDLFGANEIIPYEPCPYRFKYRYVTDDGKRDGTCQDWEIEATFFRLNKLHGEKQALAEMQRVFGEEYPRKGMLLAMGTHSQYPDTWLINGVVRHTESAQPTLF